MQTNECTARRRTPLMTDWCSQCLVRIYGRRPRWRNKISRHTSRTRTMTAASVAVTKTATSNLIVISRIRWCLRRLQIVLFQLNNAYLPHHLHDTLSNQNNSNNTSRTLNAGGACAVCGGFAFNATLPHLVWICSRAFSPFEFGVIHSQAHWYSRSISVEREQDKTTTYELDSSIYAIRDKNHVTFCYFLIDTMPAQIIVYNNCVRNREVRGVAVIQLPTLWAEWIWINLFETELRSAEAVKEKKIHTNTLIFMESVNVPILGNNTILRPKSWLQPYQHTFAIN